MRRSAVAAAALAVTVACASTPTGGGGAPTGSPAPPAHDPPLAFAGPVELVTAMDLAYRAYAVHQGVLYFFSEADGGIMFSALRIPGRAGQWSIPLEGADQGAEHLAAPVVFTMGGQPVVAAAFWAVARGSGTVPDRRVVRTVVADARDGSVKWTADAVPEDPDRTKTWGAATVVAADENHLVVTTMAKSPSGALTAVLDPATGAVRWLRSGTRAGMSDGETVVAGTASDEPAGSPLDQRWVVTGLSAADATRKWTVDELWIDTSGDPERDLYAAGDTLVIVKLLGPGGGVWTQALFARTGATRFRVKGNAGCHHDGRETVACSGPMYSRDPPSFRNGLRHGDGKTAVDTPGAGRGTGGAADHRRQVRGPLRRRGAPAGAGPRGPGRPGRPDGRGQGRRPGHRSARPDRARVRALLRA